ncbi:glutamate synthase [Lasius niger]|uniref:Glutamate synthase n=1 Tax=Lasius niger TaxID=67767 RepID=A0A0J7KN12_LASNI|nr:glutamate synthase [Lasius niger]
MGKHKKRVVLPPQEVSEPPVAGVQGGTVPAASTSLSNDGPSSELGASSREELAIAAKDKALLPSFWEEWQRRRALKSRSIERPAYA